MHTFIGRSLLFSKAMPPKRSSSPNMNTAVLTLIAKENKMMLCLSASSFNKKIKAIKQQHLTWHSLFPRLIRSKSSTTVFGEKEPVVLYWDTACVCATGATEPGEEWMKISQWFSAVRDAGFSWNDASRALKHEAWQPWLPLLPWWDWNS